MLPYLVVVPFWLLIAVVWPSIQTLHALQTQSSDRQLWLFYWVLYALASFLLHYFEWLLYAPFYVISVYIDVYYEAQLLIMLYVVLPSTKGIAKIRDMAMLCLDKWVKTASLLGLTHLRAAFSAAALSSGTDSRGLVAADGPGLYTILNPAAVTSGFTPTPDTIIVQLKVGDVVRVVEVTRDNAGKRLRGRLEKPAGWISLLSFAPPGKRWAERANEGVETNKATTPDFGAVLPEGTLEAAATTAAAVGCDPSALLLPGGGPPPCGKAGAGCQDAQVSPEEAWEAMALLESQLARADDPSEEAGARQASQMLKSMLTMLTSTNNAGMLGMAKAMVPDLGKILANDCTREYLFSILALAATDSAGAASSSSAAASAA